VFVLDGWRTVAELDQTGAVKAKHELDLPSEALVSFLRIGFDDSGENLFAASASGQRQVHLFDGQWKKLWSYPTEATESTVSDADLADLDGDGNLDLNVGFWGSEGVQSLAIDGKPRWKDDHLENVFSLTATAADSANKRGLLVVDGFGTIVPIDSQGTEGSIIRINGQFARLVRAATAPGNPQVCAIAKAQDGPESVVAFDAAGKQLWKYDLPEGVQHHAALEMLVWGQLLPGTGETPVAPSGGQWVVAAPDGSIHILDENGSLVDQFNHGAAISGLAVARYDEGPALIVASNNVVEAWRVVVE
jgi:hypothetical protein